MNEWSYDLPSGTTQSFTKARSLEEIERDIKQYQEDNIDDIFDFGLKIKDRNIFWAMMMREKVTRQIAFTLMIGPWTLINYLSNDKREERLV